ncbi:META domain-containing protein [Sphingomonas astaxanthinifaciens]|uniref:DUF306 domain-containing protein n=1 Tax=Sphingomonas astaxanthinifaciens DSM 22298 TaxID=1123267 RepID=A0ABQ5Z4Z8_9SPHN|nr:META domain-containing protein [Sphingomonas astaxanthinifaciens]GLR46441.1 hypothetical protein GCM10007925_01520 [Sphingomonas astaxanthinifaciens DSM 22298]
MRLAILATAAAVTLSGCETMMPPPGGPPPVAGASYRASGTEPFWGLTLDGRQMVFSNADGMRVAEPQPRAIHGFAGDIYQGRRINLNIVHGQRCSDGMSDRTYPDKVQVSVDGRRFEGCGGPVETAQSGTVEGDWNVLAVGRQLVSGDSYKLSLAGGRLSGQFGCNRMSGPYRIERQTLVAGPVVATRMACPDMRAETAASQILAQPMQIAWTTSGNLILSNAAGEIRLAR